MTVTINGQTYDSYATVAEADTYLAASLNYATWAALDTDGKGRFLVTASRFLSGLTWNESCLPLETNENVKTATILIAEQLALGNTEFIGGTLSEDAVKRLKAGSAEIEYQSKPWFLLKAQMPPFIFNLIRGCLYVNTVGVGAQAFGTDTRQGYSEWKGQYGLNRY